jgi:hypothetical protein
MLEYYFQKGHCSMHRAVSIRENLLHEIKVISGTHVKIQGISVTCIKIQGISGISVNYLYLKVFQPN